MPFPQPGIPVGRDAVRRFLYATTNVAEALARFGQSCRRAARGSPRLSLQLQLLAVTDRRIRRRLKRQLKQMERNGQAQN